MNKKIFLNKTYNKPRLEVIPMIDIMMFLLVFFVILSLRMIEGSGIPMEIPSSINPETIEKSTLTVGVNNLGEIIFDSKVISKNELREELKKIEEAEKYNIVIAGEKNTTLENLIEIMDEFRRVGISSVAIATQKQN